MSLDFTLHQDSQEVFSRNITHNLGKMAREARIYSVLWHPEDLGYTQARECIPLLSEGLLELVRNRDKYEAFNAPNGWGIYEDFVPFVIAVLEACCSHPDADLIIDR